MWRFSRNCLGPPPPVPDVGCSKLTVKRNRCVFTLSPRATANEGLSKSHTDPTARLLVTPEHIAMFATAMQQLDWDKYLQPEVKVFDTPILVRSTTKNRVMWYFAYGANMSLQTLAKRGVRVTSRDAAFVRNPAMKLVFKHQGGYATLERDIVSPRQNRPVHGVLYQLTEHELDLLHKVEGGYRMHQLQVETYDGRMVDAWVFVSGAMAVLAHEVAPTERYMRRLREGAAENFLDPMYQAWLSGISTVPSTGLPAKYFDTPSKHLANAFLVAVAALALVVSSHSQGPIVAAAAGLVL